MMSQAWNPDYVFKSNGGKSKSHGSRGIFIFHISIYIYFFSLAVVVCNMASFNKDSSFQVMNGPLPSDPHPLLVCGICEEPYDDSTHQAKFLSCFHTFCSKCLTNLSNKEQVNPPTIKCPNCRSYTYLPENGITGLQMNFYVASLKDMSESIEQSRAIGNTEHCSKHNNELKSYLCVTCGISVCRDCIVSDHSAMAGHSVISISDEETTFLQELNVSQKLMAENKRTQQMIQTEIALLTAAKDDAIKDTEIFMKVGLQLLEKRKNELVNHIKYKFIIKRHALLSKQKETETTIEMLDKNITEAKNKIKTGSSGHCKTINSSLRIGNEKIQSNISALEIGKNRITLDPYRGIDEFKKSLCSLGQIGFGFLPNKMLFRHTEVTAVAPFTNMDK